MNYLVAVCGDSESQANSGLNAFWEIVSVNNLYQAFVTLALALVFGDNYDPGFPWAHAHNVLLQSRQEIFVANDQLNDASFACHIELATIRQTAIASHPYHVALSCFCHWSVFGV